MNLKTVGSGIFTCDHFPMCIGRGLENSYQMTFYITSFFYSGWYHSVWKVFQSLLEETKVTCVTETLCVELFCILFRNQNKAGNTVTSLKIALQEPLSLIALVLLYQTWDKLQFFIPKRTFTIPQPKLKLFVVVNVLKSNFFW